MIYHSRRHCLYKNKIQLLVIIIIIGYIIIISAQINKYGPYNIRTLSF